MLQSSVRLEAIPFWLDPAGLARDGGGYQRRLVGGAAKISNPMQSSRRLPAFDQAT